jgi:hypothetical protein
MMLRLTVVTGRPSCSPMSSGREIGSMDRYPLRALPTQSCRGGNRKVHARWIRVGDAIESNAVSCERAMSLVPGWPSPTARPRGIERDGLPGNEQSDRHPWSCAPIGHAAPDEPRRNPVCRAARASFDVSRPSCSSASANSSSMRVRGIHLARFSPNKTCCSQAPQPMRPGRAVLRSASLSLRGQTPHWASSISF